MNKVTTDIMKLLSCSTTHALLVQRELEFTGFDFSECTQREFKRAVMAITAKPLS